MRILQALPGNPAGIEFHDFDHVRVVISNHGWFDTITGLDIGDEERFDAVMSLFRGRGVKLHLGLSVFPGFLDESLARCYTKHGFFQAGFHTTLYGLPQPLESRARAWDCPGVDVEPVTPSNIDDFASTLARGFEMPPGSPTAQTSPQWLGLPNWHLYLARVNGAPAAAAVLNVVNGVGYLSAGATIPEFRSRGCQMALLRNRIADAYELGCDLLLGGGEFGGVSQRNQERAGLRIAYTYAKWKELAL
jgi:hypothetical protein